MKVSELTGAQLDYWVAKAEGKSLVEIRDGVCKCLRPTSPHYVGAPMVVMSYQPSTNWETGGTIIEKGGISIERVRAEWPDTEDNNVSDGTYFWVSQSYENKARDGNGFGPTALISVMRAKVASVYGDEVPDEAR